MANFVKGEGKLESKLWLIGEAPGKNEDLEGRPFVGGSGQVLNSMLQEVGIQRSECYIDNIIQYQPPNNNFGIYYADAERQLPNSKLLQAHERMRNLILQHQPNVVVAFGNEALYALTGKKAITKWRGSILGGLGRTKVIPTYHPAAIMRQFDFRTACLFDLTKVKAESKTNVFPTIPPDYFGTGETFEEVMSVLDLLDSSQHNISFDIETDIELQQIISIAFAHSSSDAFCIPIFYNGKSKWNPEEEIGIIKRIKVMMERPIKRLIAQNAQFDLTYLKVKWGIDAVRNMYMDTMIAHHCVYPELPKSLAFQVSIYTNHPYHKDLIHGSEKEFYTYNCMDAARTFECSIEIEKELKEWGTWDLYTRHSHPLIKPLLEMQLNGCLIDVSLRKEIDKNLEEATLEMQKRLNYACGLDLNVGSSKQMCTFLYEDLKLPAQYTKRKDKKTGETKNTISADDDALEFLIDKYSKVAPVLKLIQDMREVKKLLSTYIRAELDSDNRIRCEYAITGTETGRLSSRKGVFGTGTNLQNIPVRSGPMVRNLFIPNEGYIFVNADLSQAEARVVAYLSKETRLQDIFQSGGDVYTKNASMVFNKPLEKITESERDLGKRLVHAANYVIGVKKFAKTINKSEDKARELLNAYYAIYPRIKRWHTEVQEVLRKTRILETPLGRKRMFFGRWNDDLVRSGIAYVPQSTVGDVLDDGLCEATESMPEGWRNVLQNHDAVLMQVPDYTPPMHIYKFIHRFYERKLTINGQTFKIPVDIKIGKRWGSLKKLEV